METHSSRSAIATRAAGAASWSSGARPGSARRSTGWAWMLSTSWRRPSSTATLTPGEAASNASWSAGAGRGGQDVGRRCVAGACCPWQKRRCDVRLV